MSGLPENVIIANEPHQLFCWRSSEEANKFVISVLTWDDGIREHFYILYDESVGLYDIEQTIIEVSQAIRDDPDVDRYRPWEIFGIVDTVEHYVSTYLGPLI